MALIVQQAFLRAVFTPETKIDVFMLQKVHAHGTVYALRLESTVGDLRMIRSIGKQLTIQNQAPKFLSTTMPKCVKGLYTQAHPVSRTFSGPAKEYVRAKLGNGGVDNQ